MKYFVLILTLFLPFTFTSAQTSLNLGGNSELSIEFDTNYFTPFAEITASVNDYTQTSQTNKIYWKVDGKSVPEFNNQRSVKLNLKDLGEATNIQVFVENANKQTVTAKKTINPIYLDIIVEPQTRTPSFYKGRALPSYGSTVNLTAMINGNINNTDYVYNWYLNDVHLDKGSVVGKYKTSAVLGMDDYNTVTLSISKTTGELLAKRVIEIAPVESELHFYEVNALYGANNIPILNSLNLIGNSAIVRAEPYYLDIKTYNKPQYIEWKVDGVRNPNRNNNPYEVTLARQGGSGKTEVGFHVRNLDNTLQGVEDSFIINY
ncbi:MAG: hypothetical protein UZ19_OD1000566 [Parcubacteria bacterium OLB19]|nr:MAG: hypothetical protein UZ19_OD1000566 [Parcubacteria bacterium OLB19]